MNIAKHILDLLRRGPVPKKHQHRFLAEYLLPPEPPTPNPTTMRPDQEAVLRRLREMPLIFFIDPLSAQTLAPWNHLLRDNDAVAYFELSGWGYLGMRDFGQFRIDLLPGNTVTHILMSPFQIVCIPLETEQELFDLYSSMQSRIITTITRTKDGVTIAHGKEKTHPPEAE